MEDLTKDEQTIIRALVKLERLWRKHGHGLVLFNGNSLRRLPGSIEDEIFSCPDISGDGGDGGDTFGGDEDANSRLTEAQIAALYR